MGDCEDDGEMKGDAVSEAKPSELAGAASDREAGIPPRSERDPASNTPMGHGVNQRAQIKMTPEEVEAFLNERHSMTMSTISGDGTIHSVAMWYGFLEGAIAFETKAKAQKVVNLRRNPALTCLVEAGETYDQLCGVTLIGTGEVIDDPARMWELGVSVFERYNGPYSDEMKPFVEAMLNKRVVVKLHVNKTVTWDHRKLGLPGM